MRGGILMALAGVGALGAVHAQAATFSGRYSESDNTSNPGLVVATQDAQPGAALDFSLTPGQSTVIPLFDLYTDEAAVNADDQVAKAISTLFTFTGPSIASGSVDGTTVGVATTSDIPGFGPPPSPGNDEFGQVSWSGSSPIVFSDGSRLDVSLNDAVFNEGYVYGTTPGAASGATVSATFTLEGAPVSAAPEPGAWALMLAGLGGVGLALRGRRGTATRAGDALPA